MVSLLLFLCVGTFRFADHQFYLYVQSLSVPRTTKTPSSLRPPPLLLRSTTAHRKLSELFPRRRRVPLRPLLPPRLRSTSTLSSREEDLRTTRRLRPLRSLNNEDRSRLMTLPLRVPLHRALPLSPSLTLTHSCRTTRLLSCPVRSLLRSFPNNNSSNSRTKPSPLPRNTTVNPVRTKVLLPKISPMETPRMADLEEHLRATVPPDLDLVRSSEARVCNPVLLLNSTDLRSPSKRLLRECRTLLCHHRECTCLRT